MDIPNTLRFAATDWDREMAARIEEYLETVPLDADGRRPGVVIRDEQSGILGVQVYPLDRYSPKMREEIIRACCRVYIVRTAYAMMDVE